MRGGDDKENWMSDQASVSRRLVQDADMSGQPLHPGNRIAGGGGCVRRRVSLPSSLVWKHQRRLRQDMFARVVVQGESKARKQAPTRVPKTTTPLVQRIVVSC
jgi:hypothetical protein